MMSVPPAAACTQTSHFITEPLLMADANPLLPAVATPSVPYSGWRISLLSEGAARTTYVAYREEDANHEHPGLMLGGSDTVVCEGYWPFRPAFSPKIILGGICLYTGVWAVQFSGVDGGELPRPLGLGLSGDLQRCLKFINKRRPIFGFQLPTRPANYHRRLIAWQRTILDRFPEAVEIRYTLPVHDYHGYIKHFEAALGEELPGLHVELDAYVEIIKAHLYESFGHHMDKLAYDLPGSAKLKKNNTASRNNDLQLYLDAIGQERVMGMEDLPEVALAHEVARRCGIVIPCAIAVVDLPDPYMVREEESCNCRWLDLQDLR